MLRLTLAAVHLMALALGIGALLQRARALAAAEREEQLKRVLFWDNLYGLVAVIWLGSGVWRAFGGLEKGTDYYLSNHAFWGKMLLLAALLGLEAVAMVTFVGWRIRFAKKQPISLERKGLLLGIHWAEFWLALGIIAMATLMARGVGVVPSRTASTLAEPDAALRRGEALYHRYCVTCHQLDGRGLGGKLAADFVADPARLAKPDSVLAEKVANGVPGTAMRGLGGELDPAQIHDVVLFVRQRFGPH
jgi:putative membrane protein